MWNQFLLRNVENFSSGLVSLTRSTALLFMMLHSSLSELTCSRTPSLEPPAQAGWPPSHASQTEGKQRSRWWQQLRFYPSAAAVVVGGGALCAITEKKRKDGFVKKRIARSLERVVSLSSDFPSQQSSGLSCCQSRSSSRGNHEQLGHSCLHLTLRHHHSSTAASWPGRSSPDTVLQPSADILSGIWHPFTLAQHRRCGTARGVGFHDGLCAHLWLSTQNRAEFPRALVNVMFEKGELSDMAFTAVQGYCADLLLWPSGATGLRMGDVFLSTGDQWPV